MKNNWYCELVWAALILAANVAHGQDEQGELLPVSVTLEAATEHVLSNACHEGVEYNHRDPGTDTHATSTFPKTITRQDANGNSSTATGNGWTDVSRAGNLDATILVDTRTQLKWHNSASVLTSTLGTGKATYRVVPNVGPWNVHAVLTGLLALKFEDVDEQDEEVAGKAEAGLSWIEVEATGDTTSVRAFIDGHGNQRFLVKFEVGAYGDWFWCGQRVQVGDHVTLKSTANLNSFAVAGQTQLEMEDCKGMANSHAELDFYDAIPHNIYPPKENEWETIITPTYVQWVTDEYPGDSDSIDVFAGPPEGDDGDGEEGDGEEGDGEEGDGEEGDGEEGDGEEGDGEEGDGEEGDGEEGDGEEGDGEEGDGEEGDGEEGDGE